MDHNLAHVVNWLHKHGYHGAESKLLEEVEARDDRSSTQSPWASPVRPGGVGGSMQLHDVVDLSPPVPLAELGHQDSPSSAGRVVEAWRSKSATPAASPRDGSGAALRSAAASPSPSTPTLGSDADEYDDDDDVGYWRVDIPGQDAYLGVELELRSSGETGSARDATCTSHPLSPSPSAATLPPSGAESTPPQAPLELPLLVQPPVGLPPRHCHSPTAAASLMLPSVPPSAASSGGRQATKVSPPQQVPQLVQPQRGPSQQLSGSPGSSDAGGGGGPMSPFASASALPQPRHRDSAAQRQAGTAQWVFDQTNSAGSDAYKSLINFLDQSPKTHQVVAPKSHLPPGAKQEQEQQQEHEQEQEQQRKLRASDEAAGGVAEIGDPGLWVEVSATELASLQQESRPLSSVVEGQVSSLSESVLQEAVADASAELQLGGEQGKDGRQGSPTALSASPDRLPTALPAVRVGGLTAGMHSMRSMTSTAAEAGDTQEQVRGGSGSPGGSNAGSSAAEERPRPRRDHRGQTDPFSFPVTSPSEHGERAPAPLFGSWPSFKNLGSPSRSADGYYKPGYCSTEDEGATPKPSARRLHRSQLSAGSLGGAVAGLPPPPGAVSVKFPHMRRSSSQAALPQYSGGTSARGGTGQYDELALYPYDEDAFEARYEVFDLRVIHRRHATGFEHSRELPLRINDLITGRYQIVDLLGQAAFSRAVQALDLKTGMLVCLKVVKNSKDYFDQSLDEVKLLRYINNADPDDRHGVLRLYDFFYFKEHLILVCELLRANLYEFAKHIREGGDPPYFTVPRIQTIARQVLRSLVFLHSLGLIHADLKPENILMRSYSACEVKVIDLGSSCFLTDRLSSYVQSRSYRAPEVILGLPYGPKIDVWSLGCIIAELCSGRVLFHNASLPAILARMEGILGAVPARVVQSGRTAHRFYTKDGRLYDRNRHTGRFEFLRPKRTSLARRLPEADPGLLDFLEALLQVDPTRRPSAADALQHPWLQHQY